LELKTTVLLKDEQQQQQTITMTEVTEDNESTASHLADNYSRTHMKTIGPELLREQWWSESSIGELEPIVGVTLLLSRYSLLGIQ
jgi:hypothetical protein